MFCNRNVDILAATKPLQRALEALFDDPSSYKSIAHDGIWQYREEIARFLQQRSSEVLLLEASLSRVRRTDLTGVQLARILRKEYQFRGAFVFLGFFPLARMAQQFSLLEEGVPGTEYIQLPVSAIQICEALDRAVVLTEEQLRSVVAVHCGVREEVDSIIHRVSNVLTRSLPQNQIGTGSEVGLLHDECTHLRDCLRTYRLEQPAILMESALNWLKTDDPLTEVTIKAALGQLDAVQKTFWPAPHVRQPTIELLGLAPAGFETILVADDDGYPLEAVAYLEERQYSVEVIRSFEEVVLTLAADPPTVFVCDQTFGDDSGAGHRLMALARQNPICRFIVALSGSALRAEEVPEADAICAGPTAKTEVGAQALHREICRWATDTPGN